MPQTGHPEYRYSLRSGSYQSQPETPAGPHSLRFGAASRYRTEAPWKQYQNKINRISIKEGITEIGDYSFYDLNQVTVVSIGKSVESIRYYVFEQCYLLNTIEVKDGLVTLKNANANGYYVVIVNNSAKVVEESSTLKTGITFNATIKNVANNKDAFGPNDNDSKIASISFYSN